jgi:retron-type reverse transcriptase
LTSLHHLIDLEWMFEAFRLTRKDGAPGVDGVTAEDYEANLEVNLSDLLARIKSGRYVAPPVRRRYIPKADGTQRPLGIPTLEDKVAQRAILLLLEPIFETEFLSCSYGFRPERSAHDALRALRARVLWSRGTDGWWMSTSPSTSTPSITGTCGGSSTRESRTASSGG